MLVKELIERLKKEPPNAEVKIETCFSYEDITYISTQSKDLKRNLFITLIEYNLPCKRGE